MGIGLNSGPFMSGNIGSAQRLAYTAMGDTINTASRIEQMTKEHARTCCTSPARRTCWPEQTARLVYIDEVDARPHDEAAALGHGPLPRTRSDDVAAVGRDEAAALGLAGDPRPRAPAPG